MSDVNMSLDEMLGKMSEAIDAENFWDTEAYAIMALEYLDSNKTNSSASKVLNWDVRDLQAILVAARDSAIAMGKREKSGDIVGAPMALFNPLPNYTEDEKTSLIDEIVNFKE